MLDFIFSDITFVNFMFLASAGFIAAFVDAIAGGGGLISLPAFLAAGIPPHTALGTNKLAAFFSSSGSAFGFLRSGKVNLRLIKYCVPFSFLGAILGVKSVLLIDSKYLYPIAFGLLVAVLVYTFKHKNLGECDNFEGFNSKNIKLGILTALLLGFYDGFFGPGTGSFIIFSLIKIFKFDFISSSGNSKFLNLASNIASVLAFMYYGKINYVAALAVGVFMLFGASVGAKVAITRGTKFIRPVFLVVTTIVTLKMAITFLKGL
ncbi:sulfite exporter TauE/SafE family protein [Cetobacterium sp.]|uniref:sulfite exporter TauE/SafE family protein n=1 Tax=Cetobacterium sp. TaxID=2071632 RepID=UPI003F39CE16